MSNDKLGAAFHPRRVPPMVDRELQIAIRDVRAAEARARRALLILVGCSGLALGAFAVILAVGISHGW